ncbi:MAG: nitrogen regulation protein NR(II) [Gammaproteobacteria bacterium]|jgi:two-component system, NtrC family, nitrogen regulation sensor histidine kinase GlnL
MAAIPMIQTELHQQILDNLSEAVALFGADLRLRYLNPAAEMLFGGSARQLLGMPFDDLVMPHEPVIEQLREAVESHHPFSKHEQIIDLYNNKQITADFTVTVLHSSFGESELLFEIKPIDRLLRITREDALMAQQVATRDLLRGLAHEIKNPLGGLRGAAQLLERELHSEEQKEYTRVIIDEADRLQKLVNRLLGPSGMPKHEDISIHEIIEYVRNVVVAEDIADIVLHRDYDPSIPSIKGDSELLIQALLNIVSNARQALGTHGNITIRTRVLRKFTIGQQQHRLVIKLDVIDDGPGIPPDIKDKLFFPMVTGRPDGTGLGLSIAQRLVHQHGGLIECESRPGHTVFSILLPIDNSG